MPVYTFFKTALWLTLKRKQFFAFQMRPSLKKVMFHLAWSPDSLPTSEAISPLLELLDGYLVSLNAALLPRNFERSLADIWDTVLLELGHQVDSTSGEKVSGFYDRLYEALEILVDFFHAEEKGLSLEVLKSGTHQILPFFTWKKIENVYFRFVFELYSDVLASRTETFVS